MDNRRIGTYGEKLTCEYLVKNGYRVLCRNYKAKFDEIDIVTLDKNVIVFIEVKTLNSIANREPMLKPEDNLTFTKIKKFKRACLYFLAKNSKLINESAGWRVDVITITIDSQNMGIRPIIRHYKNI